MPDEPTLGEISRRLDIRVSDIQQDLDQHSRRIDGKVSQDVYQIQYAALINEIAGVRAENAALRAQRERDAERLAATRRWLIASVIVPLLAVVLPLLFTMGGKS